MSRWIGETLYPFYQQRFSATEVLFEEKTEHQDLVIFENDFFGRVMLLDGVTQTTDRDEFVYHEMISHVPIFAHGNAQKVLIIGGGDGGVLREVLRHKDVECTMVEIDASVVEMSKKYFPQHSDGAFEDPRCNLVIADGLKFVKETQDRFDVIIVDSTDPIGPGEVLFTSEFYSD
jgi:spermidine synthase